MNSKIEKDVTITILHEGQEFELKTYRNEYRNLMMLISDKIYIDDFGQCTGMGRCGTCLIEFLSNSHALTQMNRNEDTTIKKAGKIHANMRLSCQIVVDETLQHSRLRIIQQ